MWPDFTVVSRIVHGGMVSASVKVFLILALSILCMEIHAPAKDQGNHLGKKSEKEQVNPPAKDPILIMEQALLQYTNDERGRRKLSPLRIGSGLRFLARGHSANMCDLRSLQHESDKFPVGWRRFAGRLKLAGLSSGGENIAFRTVAEEPQLWAQAVVKGWMNSAEHRKNILNARFTYVGIGVTPCAKRIAYAAQVFSGDPGRVPQTRK
jgi:uncharacterized protein YkwD